MIKQIHVNQHIIKRNFNTGENVPPLSIIQGGKTIHAHEIEILGPSKVVHSPDKPLSCGARIWIETNSEIAIL